MYLNFPLLTNWLLRNLKVHYRPYISLPLVSIFSKIYPVPRIQSTSFKSILILSSHLCLGLPKDLFPSGFTTKILYTFMDCSICATCPAHLSCLDLRLLIILGKEYNACSSALYNFLHSPVIQYHLVLNIFLSTVHTLFSNTLNLCSSLKVRDQVIITRNITAIWCDLTSI